MSSPLMIPVLVSSGKVAGAPPVRVRVRVCACVCAYGKGFDVDSEPPRGRAWWPILDVLAGWQGRDSGRREE
jgi:hypothetical protein